MDTLQVVQAVAPGLSDAVLIAIIAGLVTFATSISTLIINGRIDAKAIKAEAIAAAEAMKVAAFAEAEAKKVTAQIKEVEIKIDGRLTQLLEISKKEAEERGHRLGKEQEKQEEKDRKHEVPPALVAPTVLHDTGPLKLTITEGEIKVVPETTKKKK